MVQVLLYYVAVGSFVIISHFLALKIFSSHLHLYTWICL